MCSLSLKVQAKGDVEGWREEPNEGERFKTYVESLRRSSLTGWKAGKSWRRQVKPGLQRALNAMLRNRDLLWRQ